MFVNKMLAFFHSLITRLLLAHFSHSLARTKSLTQANIFLSIKFLNFFDCKKIQKMEYGVLSIGRATEWREVCSGSSMYTVVEFLENMILHPSTGTGFVRLWIFHPTQASVGHSMTKINSKQQVGAFQLLLQCFNRR